MAKQCHSIHITVYFYTGEESLPTSSKQFSPAGELLSSAKYSYREGRLFQTAVNGRVQTYDGRGN